MISELQVIQGVIQRLDIYFANVGGMPEKLVHLPYFPYDIICAHACIDTNLMF